MANSRLFSSAVTTLTVTPKLPKNIILRAGYEAHFTWTKRIPRTRRDPGTMVFYGADNEPVVKKLDHNSVYQFTRIEWTSLSCDEIQLPEPEPAVQQPEAVSAAEPPVSIRAVDTLEPQADDSPASLDPAPLFEERRLRPAGNDAPRPLRIEEPEPEPQIQTNGTIVFPKLEIKPQEPIYPDDILQDGREGEVAPWLND